MSLWGKYDAANGKPTFLKSGDPNFTPNNVYGVSATEAANSAIIGKGVSPGWVYVKTGTGPVKSFTVGAPGGGYANATISVTVTGANTLQATANASLNATGSILSIAVTNPGAGYASGNTTVVITGANTSIATATAVLAGRAGRTQYENLVCMDTIVGDAENVVFPGV